MHGRLRRLTEKTEEEIQQEKIKAQKLKQAGLAVLDKDYSPEAFQLTSVMAKLNPDFYTIWNYRKDYLMIELNKEDLSEESKLALLKNEIVLTEDIIRNKDPKCYPVWHHRRWVFNKQPSLLEPREITLCEGLLKLDQRNFHCWNHWMLVCKQMNMTLKEQLEFTLKRIKDNPSNYSAWHFRGELINKFIRNLCEKEGSHEDEIRSIIDSELNLNLNELYTECDDQSAWYYLRSIIYLMVQYSKDKYISTETVIQMIDNELEILTDLQEEEPDGVYINDFITEIKGMRTALEACLTVCFIQY